VYGLVSAFGITSDQFAMNVHTNKKREYADDPEQLPHVMADDYIDPPEFGTSQKALYAAKVMFAEEIFMNPRMRTALRQKWFTTGVIHVGLSK
jgi:transcription elongation factor SPT6